MPRVQLSPAFVKSAVCPDGLKKIDFYDCEQRGFLLEVRRSGGKTFYQRYTDDRGRERQFKIAPADVLTLSVARRRGRTIKGQALAGDGLKSGRIEFRSFPTLAHLVS